MYDRNIEEEIEAIKKLEDKFDKHMQFDRMESKRLDRLESKLNELTEAVVALARAEEKIATLIEETRQIKTKIYNDREKINVLEKKVESQEQNIQWLTKFFWILTSGVVGFVSIEVAKMILL